MSKLLSCFWQSKKKSDHYGESPNVNAKRNRREKNEVYYVQTGDFIDNSAGNQHKYGSNVKHIYRTETTTENPQLYVQDVNRQSRSYPVSPERTPVYKVYSFEQKPSFEKQRLSGRRDSRGLMIYAANVIPGMPRLSRTVANSRESLPLDNAARRLALAHGADYETEIMNSKGNPRCVAEKPAEDYGNPGPSNDKPDLAATLEKGNDQNIQGNERYSNLRRSSVDSGFVPRSSMMDNQNIVYLAADDITTVPKIKTVVRARPGSTKNFTLGKSVKPMIYRADVENSPMSGKRNVPQMTVKAKKQPPPVFATADGKILRPLSAGNVKRLSSSSSRGSQSLRLSVVRPAEAVEGFPLAQGGEVIVAAPMIGSGGGGRKKGGGKQQRKSILRNERGSPPSRGQGADDYNDYPYEGEYGRGHPYYDDASDMYPFEPVDSRYAYDQRGGYYDDGYDDYYGRGPPPGRRPPGGGRHQVYAMQMPNTILPTSADTGKNQTFKKTSKPLDRQDSCIDKSYYDSKSVESENNEQIAKDRKVMLISSAQQTENLANELDFICFSPDKCFKTSEAPDDPNSKLRWRIIIKRGDEE